MEQEIKKIFTAADNLQAEMIVGTLRENGIPALKEDIGNAGLMNIYTGNSDFGENIYVAEVNAEKARDILVGMGLIEAE